jgi:hypothetical protein
MVAEFTFMLLRRGRRSTFESDENDGEAEKAKVAIVSSLWRANKTRPKNQLGLFINIVVYVVMQRAETTFSLRPFGSSNYFYSN